MVTEAMRELVQQAAGAGELEGDAVLRGRAEHPICGDVVEVDLRMQGDKIQELAWRAQGCPACLAVAAAAPAALLQASRSEAASRLRQRLHALGGLDATEQHAERLFLTALTEAG